MFCIMYTHNYVCGYAHTHKLTIKKYTLTYPLVIDLKYVQK